MTDDILDSDNPFVFQGEVLKKRAAENLEDGRQDLNFLHTVGNLAPDSVWIVLSPLILFAVEAVIMSTIIIYSQARKRPGKRKTVYVRCCQKATSAAQTDVVKLEKSKWNSILHLTRYLNKICKSFPPATDRGKKSSQYAGMTKEEYQSSELKDRREYIQNELHESLQEELNVAEMLLSDTERRVHNLREDLSDLNHKTVERKDELLEFQCWWELTQSMFSEMKSEVAVMRRLLEPGSEPPVRVDKPLTSGELTPPCSHWDSNGDACFMVGLEDAAMNGLAAVAGPYKTPWSSDERSE